MTPRAVLRLAAPPSKSVTHRAFVLAAQSALPCRVHRPLLGADCRSTLSALAQLGWTGQIRADGDVDFEPASAKAPAGPLDCGNSGTTLRLMLGQAALLPFTTTWTGDLSLRARPNGPLLSALTALGVANEAEQGRAPITVVGGLPRRSGRRVTLAGDVSSQYASSLLLALAQAGGPSRLHLRPPVASRPYLDLTLAVAATFGLTIHSEAAADGGLVFEVAGDQRPHLPPDEHGRGHFEVDGDWSGAAFVLIAAALTGAPLALSGLRADSHQGDRAIVTLMGRFGVDVAASRAAELEIRRVNLRPAGAIDVGATPDLFPPLCALAACAPGVTRLAGSAGLRHKECDRIAAMAAGLRACAIGCTELPDGLVIEGGQPRGASVRSEHDHRVHMAFAVLGLAATGPLSVDHPDCVAISYPQFHDHLAAIAAHRR